MATKKTFSPPEGLKVTDFVKRPSLGSLGRKARVRTNFFEVTSLPETNIHHYDLQLLLRYLPLIKRIYQEFEALYSKDKFHDILPVFDGRKNISSLFGDVKV